jgi:DtxR family Mn-dependent transcriptional regulator
MNAAAPLTATLEDYLEAIFNIVSQHKVARSMEIAERLNVRRPTVTTALRTLAQKGLINYEPRSYVTLTQKGERLARCVDKRHHVLHDIFTKVLRLPGRDAEKVACLMEHGMNTQVCRKFTSLLFALDNDRELAEALQRAIEKESSHIDCETDCNYEIPERKDDYMDTTMHNLNTLTSGQSGTIVGITGGGAIKKRLREMGVTRGQTISVIKAAPLDDPIEVRVRNYNISLRREEAAHIVVE